MFKKIGNITDKFCEGYDELNAIPIIGPVLTISIPIIVLFYLLYNFVIVGSIFLLIIFIFIIINYKYENKNMVAISDF